MSNPYEAPRAALAESAPSNSTTLQSVPASYWAFWKRGWWAWLMMTLINFGIALLFLPVALALADKPAAYWTGCAVVALTVAAPLTGWVFEAFASGSRRIVSSGRSVAPALQSEPPVSGT